MKFTKLRLLGFKSFVEPTEFLIERGLTGVVGPNGCGKSNLVEALRWVMGESSYKNMRASGMDDVIFSGSGARPARNTAEVTLFLDNSNRTAPAAFNDADELQVSRRIEREAGSVYRINGREVRARDVQLLFADASTGARSPSMVGQGRIGELIAAKPQARRALLEEAAGISGLHTRRHEAELRLRAAEQNLERLDDVLSEMESQLDSLKRQARQANRYRALSADIRRAEALLLHLRWTAARAAEAEAQSALAQATAAAGEKAEAQAGAARNQAIIAAHLPQLREAEAKAAAALQRLTLALGQVEEEARRAAARQRELGERRADLEADIAREEKLIADNGAALERLAAEQGELEAEAGAAAAREAEVAARLAAARVALEQSEQRLAELTASTAAERARRDQTGRALNEASARRARLAAELVRVEQELAALAERIAGLDDLAAGRGRVAALEARAADAEAAALAAEAAAETARAAEQARRGPLAEAQAAVGRIETERATLARVLNQAGHDLFAAIVENVSVAPGYETAVGAALGEDLDIPADPAAPAHWSLVPAAADDPALPEGVEPLAAFVTAPPELARRLAQIGIATRADGARRQAALKPGQRLVSVEGDLWRWDGLTASAEAPTPAAQRLAQKNRLVELKGEAAAAAARLDEAQAQFAAAAEAAEAAAGAERAAREGWRAAQKELAAARDELAAAERAVGQLASRRAALEETRARLGADIADAETAVADAEAGLAAIGDLSAMEAALGDGRRVVEADRAGLARATAEAEGLAREAQIRDRRLAAIAADIAGWRERAANAERQIATLKERLTECAGELERVADLPGRIDAERRALNTRIAEAEGKRRQAADTLAAAETELAAADRAARAALDALSEAREARARAEERLGASAERRAEIEARIGEELGCAPHEALGRAELGPGGALPELAAIERDLDKARAERERLGAVNLRAEAEAAEIAERRDALVSERDDLIEAIRRLRAGIQSLNREGRERLLAAFGAVDDHFRRLFTHLFGGGTAELQLVESDDPLEAGLEIIARPPGKKPQTMTLLSGGEQALTALALIFAVFLTNPAPICVLDEVDAPLDDHNVERFCNLMDEMVALTDTRFVIITHNPITMARMDRLFGVTMAERGVSQLVSVDLEQAERIREAG
ncbi:MAG: chromosome partition protein Smc [Alphaproteobacteria bacterium]|nr:MAG: chromosome partition protein Smc [Alphaproteobacteria bacterium]